MREIIFAFCASCVAILFIVLVNHEGRTTCVEITGAADCHRVWSPVEGEQ